MSAPKNRPNHPKPNELVQHLYEPGKAVLVLDERGQISGANPAASRLFSIDVDSLCDRHVSELLNLNGHALDVVVGTKAKKTEQPLLLVARRADGEEFCAEVSVSVFVGEDGIDTATVIAVRDLTDRESTFSRLAHRERLATIGEATARVAHNLRNTLTGITTLVDELLEATEASDRDSLELIQGEAQRAAAMLSELLEFSRRDAARPLVSLNVVVARAAQLGRLRERSVGVELVQELSAESARVLAGASQLEQAVLNLLDNARHAVRGREGGRITVRTWVDGGCVMLSVTDNGCGIF
jgi:PAS domain S-box-containing protein